MPDKAKTAAKAKQQPEAKITVRALKDADDSLAPQAAEIMKVLKEHGGSLTRRDLVTKLGGRLKTKQPPGRVLSFYRPALVDGGYISVEKP